MAWIILGIVIGIVMALCTEKSICSGLAGAFMGFLIGVAVCFVLGGIIGVCLPTTEIIEEQEIYALSDSSTVGGKHYLSVGYVNEELVYRYVVNTDKGKHVKEEKASDVYLHEGDYQPSVKTHSVEFKESWYKWIAHDVFRGEERYVEFYVPENTITTEYNVDLQ